MDGESGMSELTGQGKLHGLGEESLRAEFRASSRGLQVQAGAENLLLDYQWLTVTRGGFNDEMWVVLAERQGRSLQLYVQQPPDFGARLLEQQLPPLLAEQVRAAESRQRGRRRTSKLAAVALVALLGLALWKLPSTLAYWAARAVPPEWEESLGRSAAAELLAQGQCTSPELLRPVQEITERLAAAAGPTPYQFRVHVLSSEQVNAFALPGGYLFVNHGLIREATGPDEVAGVMGHEVQHVLLKHGVRNVLHQAGIGLMLSLLVGNDGGLGVLVAQGAAGLSRLSFSRGQESEADEHALGLLVGAGFDPQGMVRFFRRLSEQESGVPELLSTHPHSETRAAALETRIRELRLDRRPLQSPWPAKDAPCATAPAEPQS
jgi:beta-barrel assembly-enhancing protease